MAAFVATELDRDIADELTRTYPQVRAVHHASNRGYGGALRSGFQTATRELVFYTDGDGQYDVRDHKKSDKPTACPERKTAAG